MENETAVVQKTDGYHGDKLTRQLSKDAKVSPSCLMPKFEPPKVYAIRSFPECFTRFAQSSLHKTEEDIVDELEIESMGSSKMDAAVGERLVCSELHVLSCDIECESIEHIGLISVVDTLKQNVQVDSGLCVDRVDNLRTRESDLSRIERLKVFSVRDFPNGLILGRKFQEDCMGEPEDVPIDHKSSEDHVKETNNEVDFGSQGALVDPVENALSCKSESEKQEPVVADLEEIQSDVDMELDEALEDEETIGKFECGEHDNNNYVMVENVPLVKTPYAEDFELLNRLCTSVVYPPKRRKVFAIRDFPIAFQIVKAHNVPSERNRDHRAADKLGGNVEAACDSKDDAEPFEAEIESQESSNPSKKGLSFNLRKLPTPHKEYTVSSDTHIGVVSGKSSTIYQLTSLEHDGTSADEQELENRAATSKAVSTQSTSKVNNSNKLIQGKEVGLKCINKTIDKDPVASPKCPSNPNQCYQSDIKSYQDKGKGEGSVPLTTVLALMAPMKCKRIN